MKVVLFTLFLIFVSTSALRTAKHGTQVSIHSLHLEKISSLGSAIKGLIQLADAGELSAVLDILKSVRDELVNLLTTNQAQLSALILQHDSDKAAAEDRISTLESELDTNGNNLNNANARRVQLEDDIAANINAINVANAAIQAEQERRESAKASNQEKVSNANKAVAVIVDAQAILDEISGQDLSAGGSFIQMQKKRFSKSLALLQTHVAKLKLRSSPIEIFVKELIQIAQDAEGQVRVNADILLQLEALLEQIKQTIVQEAKDAQDADDADDQQSQANLALLSVTITVQSSALQDNQSELVLVQANIADLEASKANLEQNLSDAQDNLASVEAIFSSQSDILNGYIARLQVDIDVLQSAEVFLTVQASLLDGDNSGVEVVQSGAVDDESSQDQPEAPEIPVWVGGDSSTWSPEPLAVESYEPEPASWQTPPAGDVQEGDAPAGDQASGDQPSEDSEESSDGSEASEDAPVASAPEPEQEAASPSEPEPEAEAESDSDSEEPVEASDE